MTYKTRFLLGVSLIILGQILTFQLWFDGNNIQGNNSYSTIVLLSSLISGYVLIVKPFNPKNLDIKISIFIIPALIYYFYPMFMNKYRENKLKGNTTTTYGIVTEIGEHHYRRKPSKYYYEFQVFINDKKLIKFNEDVFDIVNWKLKTGDTIRIKYYVDNENILDALGKE